MTDEPVLLLLNSIGTTHAIWEPVADLIGTRFHLVHLDTRGHGDSPPVSAARPTSIDDLAADLMIVLDRIRAKFGVDRVDIAGMSLGAMVATRLAITQPERIGRLAIICGSAYPNNASSWLERIATARVDGLAPLADAAVGRWLLPETVARHPERAAALRSAFVSVDPQSYVQCAEAIMALDLRPDLHLVATPTLVAVGEHDVALPVDHSRVIAAGISNARLEIISEASHLPTLEQPEQVARLLVEHFTDGAQ